MNAPKDALNPPTNTSHDAVDRSHAPTAWGETPGNPENRPNDSKPSVTTPSETPGRSGDNTGHDEGKEDVSAMMKMGLVKQTSVKDFQKRKKAKELKLPTVRLSANSYPSFVIFTDNGGLSSLSFSLPLSPSLSLYIYIYIYIYIYMYISMSLNIRTCRLCSPATSPASSSTATSAPASRKNSSRST
jgi:hypothetical protein